MEAAFVSKQVCCSKKCREHLLNWPGDGEHSWLMTVVHKIYPFANKKIQACLLRDVRDDGSVADRPFNCFFMDELARQAERKLQLGDVVCLYRPILNVWKESTVYPELMDLRALVKSDGRARVLHFSLTSGSSPCTDCEVAVPDSSAAPASQRLNGDHGSVGQATSAVPDAASADGAGSDTVSSTCPADQPQSPPRSPAPRSTSAEPGPTEPPRRQRGRPRKKSPPKPTSGTVEPPMMGRGRLRKYNSENQGTPTPPAADPPVVDIASSTSPETPAVGSSQPVEDAEVAGSSAAAPTGAVPADAPAASTQAADREPIDASQNAAADFMLRVPSSEQNKAYTLLANIGRGDPRLRHRPNLMGIIVSVPQPPRCTGRSHMIMVVIKDPSCRVEDSPRADFLLFGFFTSLLDLPSIEPDHGLQVGNIVRARHVKVEKRAGKLDGRVFQGRALTVFSGGVDDPLTPLGAADPPPLVSDAELARVRWLREWWAVEQHHQERIAGALDAKFSDVARPGLYNLRCKVQAVEEVGGEMFFRVEDGTRCPLPCREPRPGDPDDPDNPPESESETQVFREQPDTVSVRVADRRCAEAVRHQWADGARFLHLLRVRVTDELSQQETCTTGLAFALRTEDEPLVLPLGKYTDEVLAIRLRLAEAQQRQGGGGQPSAAPPPPAAPAQPPEPAEDQPRQTAGAERQNFCREERAARLDEPMSRDLTAVPGTDNQSVTDAGQQAAAPAATAGTSRPAPVAIGSIFTEVHLSAATRAREDGEPQSQCSGAPVPAADQRTCVDETSREPMLTERRQPTETSSQGSGPWYPVQRGSLELSDTRSDLQLASQRSSQAADGCSQASAEQAAGFTTAPQSPAVSASAGQTSPAPDTSSPADRPRAVVTDETLNYVPLEEVPAQPDGRPFRTRCLLRCGATWPDDSDPRPMLMATCLQPDCRTQFRGAAMPQLLLNDNLEPAYMCPRCMVEMRLSLAVPFELHAISGGEGSGWLQAVAAGESAARLLSAPVRVGSLLAVRRRLAAVAAAARAGLSGEVGLLPLPEPDRRYMIVDTALVRVTEHQ